MLFYESDKIKLFNGDSLKVLSEFPDNSIDSIITDPPYGLSFMGKKWDYSVPGVGIWKECLRVLKPGGHLLAFGGTRTYHRLVVNIEDAGFEIRDQIAWVFSSGFPKALDIGKSVNQLEINEWSKIDKALNNIDKRNIIEVWKTNSNNVKIVETQLLKNQIIAGQDMPRKNFVALNVVQNNNQEKLNLLVSFAEKNLKEAQAINIKINTVLENVEAEIKQLQDNVNSVEQQSQNQNHKSLDIFTAQCDVKEWLKENTTINHKADEALKILRGNKKYSNEEITNMLCAVLTENLKHTILNQSKTFRSLDMKLQMEYVSATNVIITEYTAGNLISNTVNILKSKVVDKIEGNKRESIGLSPNRRASHGRDYGINFQASKNSMYYEESIGFSDAEGWKTTLKPALEPICLARKPISEKTIAENFLKYGVGGLNIDKCRVPIEQDEKLPAKIERSPKTTGIYGAFTDKYGEITWSKHEQGRFPANVIHDGSDDVVDLFPQQKGMIGQQRLTGQKSIFSLSQQSEKPIHKKGTPDNGSAARFFYCAKASPKERNFGLSDRNTHPTVKPIKLMSYLCKLITPKNGIVLDPFNGSGSTGIAAVLSGFNYVGIELESDYCEISKQRFMIHFPNNIFSKNMEANIDG